MMNFAAVAYSYFCTTSHRAAYSDTTASDTACTIIVWNIIRNLTGAKSNSTFVSYTNTISTIKRLVI